LVLKLEKKNILEYLGLDGRLITNIRGKEGESVDRI
jgi:hypothetical protein